MKLLGELLRWHTSPKPRLPGIWKEAGSLCMVVGMTPAVERFPQDVGNTLDAGALMKPTLVSPGNGPRSGD